MNPSLYSALLSTLGDEEEGVIPPLDTHVPVVAPESVDAAFAPPAPAPVEPTPPPEPADPLADVKAKIVAAAKPAQPEEKPSLRSLADKYGLSMEDMLPAPPTPNRSTLASDIGRAGNTIGSALAGVKPDGSTFDRMEQRGAQSAAQQDAAIGGLTNFKRQLMLKVAEDKRKGGKDKIAFEDADAFFKNDKYLAPVWAKFVADARAAGREPDVELFKSQAGGYRSQAGAQLGREYTQGEISKRQEDSQQFHLQTMAIGGDIALDAKDYEEKLKTARDARQAFHPDRALIDPHRPPSEVAAREQQEIDADAQFITGQVAELRALIKENGPDVLRVIPGFRGRILSLQQSIAAATLRANKYGVPTGKDWEMVDREIGDPTRFVDIVTHQQDSQIVQAVRNINLRTESAARTRGYGPWIPGSGVDQSIPTPTRPNPAGRALGAPAAATSPGAAAPSGKVLVSDGKESFELDASDAAGIAEAEAEGFKRVK